MISSSRERFLSYIRSDNNDNYRISPWGPPPDVVKKTLQYHNLPVTDDEIRNNIILSKEFNYDPMFMTEFSDLIFPWQIDESRSNDELLISVISTSKGDWLKYSPRKETQWSEVSGCPVRTETDHKMLVAVCEQVGDLEKNIRDYFKDWRRRVGEDGVIVIGHPHASWLGYQISPQNVFLHYSDLKETFIRSMDAVYEASIFVMNIAMEEGMDFMSDSSYGLEMTSPQLFEVMDLPYIQSFSKWTHDRNGLFWFHNCGRSRRLITDGYFNKLGADVIETIAPPPEGDNDLSESRRCLDRNICTKGNLNLLLLRDGTPDEIMKHTRNIIRSVNGYKHIISTACGILQGTPPENLLAFLNTALDYRN